MIRVGFDEQVFLAQSRGGISRYFVELIRAFQADSSLGIQPIPGWAWAQNAHAREAHLSKSLAFDVPAGPLTAVEMMGYYLANTPRRRAARRAEVLHHTYSHDRFFNRNYKGIRVSTVYDMIPELYPDSFTGGNPHLAKRRYIADSDVVICISESTRRDVIAVLGDPGRPMPVTYLGVDKVFSPHHRPLKDVPDRYLLFVGTRSGYKDFSVLLEAFAALDDDATALVAVGGGRFTDPEIASLTKLGILNRVVRIDASDAQLPQLYANALAFVFPSRHEGFGLPTLEAMASATPVVLADSSSHPEVGGEVARYFPVGDAAQLANLLAELLQDDALRTRLGHEGVARAAAFSWQATAHKTAAIYQRAVLDDPRC